MWQIHFTAFSFHEVIKLSFVTSLPVDCHYLLLWRCHHAACCHLAVLVSVLAWDRMDWQWNLITAAGRGGGVSQAGVRQVYFGGLKHLILKKLAINSEDTWFPGKWFALQRDNCVQVSLASDDWEWEGVYKVTCREQGRGCRRACAPSFFESCCRSRVQVSEFWFF